MLCCVFFLKTISLGYDRMREWLPKALSCSDVVSLGIYRDDHMILILLLN